LDVDRTNVFDLEPTVRALGCQATIYSSHSFGLPRDDGGQKLGGRVVLAGDREWTPDDHRFVMAAANNLLGDRADTQAMSIAQAMGAFVRRSPNAVTKRVVIDGGVLSIDKLIEHGRSLVPVRSAANPTSREARTRTRAEMELALEGIPNDETTDYNKWMLTAGAVYSALGEDGLPQFMVWSARNAKHDPDRSEAKYLNDVAGIEYDADDLTWKARWCAEDIAHTFHPAGTRVLPGFEESQVTPEMREAAERANQALGAGIPMKRAPKMLDRAKLVAQFGSEDAALTWAVAFMRTCWSDQVYRSFLSAYAVPAQAMEAGEGRAAQLREKEIAAGRVIVEAAGNIHENIERVCGAVLDLVSKGELGLFQQGGSVVVHVRKGHRGRGAKAVAITEPAALRTILSKHVVVKSITKDRSVTTRCTREREHYLSSTPGC